MTRHEDFYKTSKTLEQIDKKRDKYLIIHYSCESFYNKTDGKSPRISAIAVQRFDNSQTDLFSLHKSAELELAMLTDFFDFAKINNEKYWIHWNMRDSNYGFKALEHRYRVLSGNQPSTFVPDNKKIDLARLFKIRFTDAIIGYYVTKFLGG